MVGILSGAVTTRLDWERHSRPIMITGSQDPSIPMGMQWHIRLVLWVLFAVLSFQDDFRINFAKENEAISNMLQK